MIVKQISERRTRHTAQLIVFVVIINVVALGVGAFTMMSSYQQYEQSALTATQNLSASLIEDLGSKIDSADQSLLAVGGEFGRQALTGQFDAPLYEDLIRHQLTHHPALVAFGMTNAEGEVVGGLGGGKAPANSSTADRPYFIQHRDHPDSGLVISEPVKGKISGHWGLVLSRRLNRVDGKFAGMVYANMGLGPIESAFSSLNLGANGSVSLRDDKLRLILNVPRHEGAGAVGSSRISADFQAALQQRADAGSYFTASSSPDQIERAQSYRKHARYPFYITVGLAKDDFLLPWRTALTTSVSVFIAFALTSGVGCWLLILAWHRNERTHSEAQQRYRALVESQPTGIVVHQQGIIIYANPSGTSILGAGTPDELIGRRVLDMVHPDFRQTVLDRMKTRAQTGIDPTPHESRLIRLDGTVIDVQMQGTSVQYADKPAIQVTFTDITERIQADARLRTNDERWKLALESAGDGAWDWNRQTDVTAYSKGYLDLFGYKTDSAWTVIEGWNDRFYPGDEARALAALAAYDQGLAPMYCSEYRVACANGDWKWILSRGLVITKTADGKPLRMVGTYVDISQRMQHELQQRLNDKILSSISEGVIIASVDQTVLSCTAAQALITGYTSQEIVGSNLQMLQGPLTDASAVQEIRMAMRSGTVFRGEILNYRKDGTTFWNDLSITPVRDEAGEITHYVGVTRDVSERRLAGDALRTAKIAAEHANTAKSRFLATASHDLRQPIFALSLFMDILKGKRPPADDALLNKMSSCIDSLSELLTDLLQISKLEAGVVAPNVSDFLVSDVLSRLITVHTPSAQMNGLHLRWRPTALHARTDSVLLARILSNFIANAIRYTERGGVLIACRRHHGKTWIEVWDSGIGIPQDKTREIFEEYRQLAHSMQRRGSDSTGSGLGLAIAAKTAALLGLEIRVKSRLGHGSMFAIELPLGADVATMTQRAIVSRPLRIALVDDNASVLYALCTALEGHGHQVVAGHSGSALLNLLGGTAPDVVISDYRLLNGETGFDVTKTVRKAFREDLPALIVTGDTDPAILRKMDAQAILVHHKPMDLDTLLASLDQLIK